ncbi:GNAT family N-acetyltransferase [Halobacterium yunchengense]|uniref:GNAT family N-acetyltransferase n=1 Tax=Halobacterium yunchengense TaxID=3108497 RepID=UPI00300ACE39
MAQADATSDGEDYSIRAGGADDCEAFRSLYEAVWGRSKSAAWFDWRFADNPFTDRVELVVAERAGRVVGAEPLLALPLATPAGTVAARQPVDWIVHPEHRRRGLFTRMTERLLARTANRAALLFNFPTDALRPGLHRFDWTEVGAVPTRYRVQHPSGLAAWRRPGDRGGTSLLARAATPPVRAGLAVADRLTSSPPDVDVERVAGTATRAIRTVYSETRPDGVHVPRTEAYLDWRFANPHWDVATYVARRDDRPAATLAVGRETVDGTAKALLLDVQPMTTIPSRAPAFAAALDAALADLADVDVVSAAARPFPGVLGRRGFLRDDRFPLSRCATTTTHVVRPLPDPEAGRVGADVFDADGWTLALADRDVE